MRLLILTLGLLIANLSYSQEKTELDSIPNKLEDQEFTIVEEPGYFPGGMGEFYKYIGRKLKYPKDARQNNIQGKVIVEFTVGTNGKVVPESIKIIKSLYESCDNVAIELVKNSPKWVPGKQHGQPVEQKMTLPITFK